jgi:hypothetical protein
VTITWTVGQNGWWVRADGTVWQFAVVLEKYSSGMSGRFLKPRPPELPRRAISLSWQRCFHRKKDALRFAVLESLAHPP